MVFKLIKNLIIMDDVFTVAGETPQRCELEAGKKYAWCTCGNSEKQPYCDGSHRAVNAEAAK